MNVLVTGGAGYIGSHVCVELLQSGHDVVSSMTSQIQKPEALDRFSADKKHNQI